MRVCNLNIGKVILAPLEGVNDLAFRSMCSGYGSALNFTEMLSSTALVRENSRTLEMARTLDDEKPVGIQVCGNDPKIVGQAIKNLDGGYPNINPDLFNINFGCPVPNAMKQDIGAALLKNPEKVGELVSAMRGATDLPISAKIRLGISPKQANYMKISKIIEKAGADFIVVHARYQQKAYSEDAHWHTIKELKDELSIPVVGNGDVFDEESAKMMLDETGCDAVMVARGCIGNPFIFKRINSYLDSGKKIEQKDKFELFLEYLELARKYNVNYSSIKEHAMYFTKGVPNSAKLRDSLRTVRDISQIVEMFKKQSAV